MSRFRFPSLKRAGCGVILGVSILAACGGCQRAPREEPATSPAASPSTAAEAQVKPVAPSAAQESPGPAATVQNLLSPTNELAGYIFGVPVPMGNYGFAWRVFHLFPHPWEEGLEPEAQERAIWEALVLHFESYRRGVTVSEAELDERINAVLQGQSQSFTRSGDPAAYAAWVQQTLAEPVELFENQMRYLYQIDKLKDSVRASLPVSVSDAEVQEEFLNEQHHVGGEMVTFDEQAQAQAFYEQVKSGGAWEAMKAKGEPSVRPVSLMTLEAYMDLWGIPKDQMYAFHAMELGAIGPPMPFGRQWCVYRLLDKRTGDLATLPAQRERYVQQLTVRQQYAQLKTWIKELVDSAHVTVLPRPSAPQPHAESPPPK